MPKKYEDDFEEDEDEDLDEDEEDEPEKEIEKVAKKLKKAKARPRPVKEQEEEDDSNWEYITQTAFSGYRNKTTGEVITAEEAIRRILDFAEEAAKNSR